MIILNFHKTPHVYPKHGWYTSFFKPCLQDFDFYQFDDSLTVSV
jgi:hypothetical protein